MNDKGAIFDWHLLVKILKDNDEVILYGAGAVTKTIISRLTYEGIENKLVCKKT